MTQKVHKIRKTYKDRSNEITGTLDELIDYFGYTLEVGHSYKSSILLKPKTIKSFLSNLDRAFDVKEGKCYERTLIEYLGEVESKQTESVLSDNQKRVHDEIVAIANNGVTTFEYLDSRLQDLFRPASLLVHLGMLQKLGYIERNKKNGDIKLLNVSSAPVAPVMELLRDFYNSTGTKIVEFSYNGDTYKWLAEPTENRKGKDNHMNYEYIFRATKNGNQLFPELVRYISEYSDNKIEFQNTMMNHLPNDVIKFVTKNMKY